MSECKECGHRRGYHIQRGKPSCCTIFNCNCKTYIPKQEAEKVECKECRGEVVPLLQRFVHEEGCPVAENVPSPKVKDSRPDEYAPFSSIYKSDGISRNERWGFKWKAYALQVEKERDEAREKTEKALSWYYECVADNTEAQKLNTTFTARLKALTEAVKKDCEWVFSDYDGESSCQTCNGNTRNGGHKDDCALAQALKDSE